MIQFHLYTPAGTQSEPFFARPIETGAIVLLDENNGFSANFFADKETSELLYFVVLPNEFPRTPDAVESLLLVEAQIVEPNTEAAKARVSWTQPLGEWARTATFSRGDEIGAVPAPMKPSPEAMDQARETLRVQEAGLWVGDAPARGTPALWAHYFFKGAVDKRGLIFAAPGAPSYLVKMA